MTESATKSPSEYILSSLSGNVLLIGGYGAGNIGDEAILAGLLRNVSPEIKTLSVVSHDPQETSRLHESTVPESDSFKPIQPSIPTLTSQLRSNKHIVIGGGGIFSRYMGPYASKIPYYTTAAHALRKSVHWAAIGVYPSTPNSTMYPLRYTMNQSNSVSVRDPISKTTLRQSGVKNVQLVPDPATHLTPNMTPGVELLKESGIDPDDKIIGIAARRVMNDENNTRLQQAYHGIANYFGKEGWKIVFIPFCHHPYEYIEQDHTICHELASQYECAVRLSYDHPEDLLGAVSLLDAMVATRLHSMIFAYMANIPFVAIEYADKCTSLLQHYDVESRGVPLQTVTAPELIRILSNQL